MTHRPYLLRQDTGKVILVCPQCVAEGKNSAPKFPNLTSAELARDYHVIAESY